MGRTMEGVKEPKAEDLLGLRFGTNYFLYFAIFGIISPYLQIMLRNLGYSPAQVGFFLGLLEFVGIFGPMASARRADSSSRFKPGLYLSGSLLIAGLCLLVTVKTPIATACAICLISLGLKTPTSILDAALLRAASGSNKPLDYGAVRSSGSVGFIVVTLIAQFIPGFNESPPKVMATWAVLFTLLFLLSLTIMPEASSSSKLDSKAKSRYTSNRPAPSNSETIAFSQSGKSLNKNIKWIDATFIVGLVVILLGRIAIAAVGSFFSLYLTEELHWDAIGALWAVSSIAEVPLMIYARRFIKKHSPMQGVAIASGALVVRLLIYAVFPTKAGAVIGQALHSLCYGLFLPSAVAFINLKTPPQHRTTGMALFNGIGMGLPTLLGSIIGGNLIERFGYRPMFALFSLFAVASLVTYFIYKKQLIDVK